MRYQPVRRYPHDRFSLGRDSVTGEAVFAINLPLYHGHYPAYYRLSEDELESFLPDEAKVGVVRRRHRARPAGSATHDSACCRSMSPNPTGVPRWTATQHTIALVDKGLDYLLYLSKSPPTPFAGTL